LITWCANDGRIETVSVEKVSQSAELRRRFFVAFWRELLIIWPILSGLVGVQLVLGMLIGYREGWGIGASAYFTFVTGLTIGFGDFVPSHAMTRIATVMIGFIGILLTGLIAALGVSALQTATADRDRSGPG
jgi:hypothetical protein